MLTPNLTLSVPATTRWKKKTIRSPDHFSISQGKDLRRLITSRDASKFISISATPGLKNPKSTKNEDLREISTQLVSLKKKHDINKSLNLRNQVSLEKKSKFIENFKYEELKVINSTDQQSNQVSILERLCEDVKRKQEEALETSKVYRHMLSRMKISRLFIDSHNWKMMDELRGCDFDLKDQEIKKNKAKDSSVKAKKAYSILEDYVKTQGNDREEQLEIIKKDAEIQIKYNENRDVRIKRQLEIAEAAADEERNNRATQIRESLIVHRLLYTLLEVKLKFSQKRFALIDEAFRKIKNQYGHMEPFEIVERILTKEQAYSDLLTSIRYYKEKISEISAKILNSEEKIELTKSMKTLNDPNKQWRLIYIKNLKDNILNNERLRKLKIVQDKIKFWSERMLQKLGTEVPSNKRDLKFHLIAVKKRILEILKNDIDGVLKNKSLIENMKVDQILKYNRENKRRKTFITNSIEEDSNKDLVINDDYS